MTYRGHVKNGTIVLEPPATLPEGLEVEVHPVSQVEATDEEHIPSLAERYKKIIGIVHGLPPDSSTNHDHYLYGTPKR